MTLLHPGRIVAVMGLASLAGLPLSATGTNGVPQRAGVQEQRHAYVAVTDSHGRPIAGLGAADVTVNLGGRAVPVLRFIPAREPLALVFTTEGVSANYTPAVRRLMRAVVEAVRRHHSDSRVGLMLSPGSAAPVLHGVSEHAAELNQEIARYFGSDETSPLLASIRVAAETLSTDASARRVIIALSLGTPRNVEASFSGHILTDLRKAGASLWSAEIGGGQAGGRDRERLLAEAARSSGGRRDLIRTTAAAESVGRLIELVLSQYMITYVVPPGADPSATPHYGLSNKSATILAPAWARQ